MGLEVGVDLLQAVNAFFVDLMHLLELALPLDHLCDLLHKIGVVLLQVPVLLFQRALQLTDVLISPRGDCRKGRTDTSPAVLAVVCVLGAGLSASIVGAIDAGGVFCVGVRGADCFNVGSGVLAEGGGPLQLGLQFFLRGGSV